MCPGVSGPSALGGVSESQATMIACLPGRVLVGPLRSRYMMSQAWPSDMAWVLVR